MVVRGSKRGQGHDNPWLRILMLLLWRSDFPKASVFWFISQSLTSNFVNDVCRAEEHTLYFKLNDRYSLKYELRTRHTLMRKSTPWLRISQKAYMELHQPSTKLMEDFRRIGNRATQIGAQEWQGGRCLSTFSSRSRVSFWWNLFLRSPKGGGHVRTLIMCRGTR